MSKHSTPTVTVRARVGSALHRLWLDRKTLTPSLSDIIHDAATRHEAQSQQNKEGEK